MKHSKLLTKLFVTALALIIPGLVSAAPFGTLTTTACSGQGVTVTFTTIDWLPAGNGTGCINTVTPTDISYVGGGPLTPGVEGLIADLTGALPVIDFMTFTGHPLLHFDLTSVGPGVANTVCADTFNPSDPVCSIVPGSPFVLRPGAGGATVTLAAFGTARDASNIGSTWIGTFSVDFAGETPDDVADRFLANGSITTGHSGSFVLTPIPEPMSFVLIGGGLVGLVLVRRRRA